MYSNSLIIKNEWLMMNNLENSIVQYIKMKIQKRYEWNILILVILIMLTVAMMWLLTMSFLKQMFAYTINLDWYYKSYYLSKAWIELALTEIDNSDVWFSNEITGANNIFTQNLCSGLDCSVSMNIRGRTKFLSEKFWEDSNDNVCNNPIVLGGWESFALPLFLQSRSSSDADILSWENKGQYDYIVSELNKLDVIPQTNTYSNTKLNLSLVFEELDDQLKNLYISSEDFNSNMINSWIGITSLDSYASRKLYLMISNLNSYPVSFCLNMKSTLDSKNIEMPATKFYVVSLWNYQWRYVWMQAIYAQPIPSFMFYGYNEHGSAAKQE